MLVAKLSNLSALAFVDIVQIQKGKLLLSLDFLFLASRSGQNSALHYPSNGKIYFSSYV